MNDWNIGISTGCFYQISIFDCLEDIRNAGFCTIEISSSPSHLDYHNKEAVKQAKAKMAELGIEPYSFHAPFGADIDITSLDEKVRDNSYQELLNAADAAVLIGVRYLVIHPGPEKPHNPSDQDHMQRLENAGKVLNKVASFCKDHKIDLVLENVLPHLIFGNMRDMLWILGSINTTNVGTCMDTGHAALSGDIDIITYKISGYLRYIHAHDNKGKYDDHLPPGSGTIDWHKLLLSLTRTAFRGSIILELAGNQQRRNDEVLSDARQSRLFLRNLSKLQT
ncbi:MAG: hypothetical protein DKM50_09540 [Candidatus Margulisiibacteriota bacterium]|nr:MAG: hypothetical protein A2X43_05035 [Candidatus Margulisbacteria bacterium GWD2_39_127]OGI02366.1 MAG: hypothetical protein A2X42_09435 [Candidatus Margulisbacteria bacterium GWF2_38_17]OGI08499.1 MAG: hypothetical protein A2X41_07225 [Candidatus Margulisbacteria bacterium GWE2_39_32]PZM79011.1 MAG: hypothetical protein DKM50_09540 [Candidatus Margulisiibacteriota bacterium]HAR64210.1 hypothetical protein [Candidatus Margulisiibacteriota bacterium]